MGRKEYPFSGYSQPSQLLMDRLIKIPWKSPSAKPLLTLYQKGDVYQRLSMLLSSQDFWEHPLSQTLEKRLWCSCGGFERWKVLTGEEIPVSSIKSFQIWQESGSQEDLGLKEESAWTIFVNSWLDGLGLRMSSPMFWTSLPLLRKEVDLGWDLIIGQVNSCFPPGYFRLNACTKNRFSDFSPMSNHHQGKQKVNCLIVLEAESVVAGGTIPKNRKENLQRDGWLSLLDEVINIILVDL